MQWLQELPALIAALAGLGGTLGPLLFQDKKDQDQLAAALPMYDALYRWARDGFDETHEHPTGPGA